MNNYKYEIINFLFILLTLFTLKLNYYLCILINFIFKYTTKKKE